MCIHMVHTHIGICANFIFISLNYVASVTRTCSQLLAQDGDEEGGVDFIEITKCKFYSLKQQQHGLCAQNEDVSSNSSDLSLQLATSKDDIESFPY